MTTYFIRAPSLNSDRYFALKTKNKSQLLHCSQKCLCLIKTYKLCIIPIEVKANLFFEKLTCSFTFSTCCIQNSARAQKRFILEAIFFVHKMTKTLKYFGCISTFGMEKNFITFKFSLVNIVTIVLATANWQIFSQKNLFILSDIIINHNKYII